MSCLYVWLPRLAGSQADQAFARWLARGTRLPAGTPGRTAGMRAHFRFAGATLPVAALRHHAHAADAADGAWLCADPVYVRGEPTGARLMGWPVDDLTAAEAQALAASLRPLLGDAGMPLEVDTPSAWCVRLPGGAPVASFVPPEEALGASLLECLPGGDAGRSWRRLFNEAQVLLHAHPVNAERIAAGQMPVNALWFWGGGALPGALDTALRGVASDDDALRGLARLAGVPCTEPDPQAVAGTPRDGDRLLDLDAPAHAGFAATWLPRFRDWLRSGRFAELDFRFPDGQGFRIRHIHRLRFWRRT